MAVPEQAMSQSAIGARHPSQRLAWLIWILASVIGAVLGALAVWGLRTLFLERAPSFIDALHYATTVVDAMVFAGTQWLVLRHYRVEAYWWVPATIVAGLLNAIMVLPTVLSALLSRADISLTGSAVLAGAAALAAGGLVVGTAQALILRGSAGNVAWAWIPATVVGGALAGAVTTAVSAQLFGLPYYTIVSTVAAVGALLTAASQAPVLLRMLR